MELAKKNAELEIEIELLKKGVEIASLKKHIESISPKENESI